MTKQTQAPEVICSLSDEAMRARRAMVRQSLLPHIIEASKLGAGLRLTFPESAALRSRVETFMDLERQCCGFLTFALSPPEHGLVLTIDGPPEARTLLENFADALATS